MIQRLRERVPAPAPWITLGIGDDAASVDIPAGERAVVRYGAGQGLPAETIDAIREHRVSIKGPLSTPVGGGFRSLVHALKGSVSSVGADRLTQVCNRVSAMSDATLRVESKSVARSLREEFEAVRIAGSVLMSQPVMQEIMAGGSNTHPLVIIDHKGRQGLDAAAYFMGHGLENVRCLRGGIDAWAQEVDAKMPRYKLEQS